MQCNHLKENSQRCEAHSMRESEFCFLHNPLVPAEEKKDAQRRGGESRLMLSEPLPYIEVSKPSDVISLLSDTIMRVRSGELDSKIANCIGVLSGHLLHAFETSEMRSRAEEIERLIIERRRR